MKNTRTITMAPFRLHQASRVMKTVWNGNSMSLMNLAI